MKEVAKESHGQCFKSSSSPYEGGETVLDNAVIIESADGHTFLCKLHFQMAVSQSKVV